MVNVINNIFSSIINYFSHLINIDNMNNLLLIAVVIVALLFFACSYQNEGMHNTFNPRLFQPIGRAHV